MVQAVNTLRAAFFACHRDAFHNKRSVTLDEYCIEYVHRLLIQTCGVIVRRRILIYFTVACILTDQTPGPAILRKYQLYEQFSGLLLALRRGHLASYCQELSRSSRWHARFGNLILLQQRGIWMVYRRLFRRM